jgi:hypothetical protein
VKYTPGYTESAFDKPAKKESQKKAGSFFQSILSTIMC